MTKRNQANERKRSGLTRRQMLAGSATMACAVAAPAILRAADSVKYRVAVIGDTGHGDYGHNLDIPWLDVPGAEVLAVADPDEKGRAAAAQRVKAPKQYADYRKMLDEVKPEYLSICPRWVDQHRDLVLAAVERGVKGIYLEKPLCRTLAEADEMVEACRKANTKVALAFQTRYCPKLTVIRELIESGKIGKVIEYRARGKEDARGGAEDLWVLGPHLMNLIHYFSGEPKSCYAEVLAGGKPIGKGDVTAGKEGISLLAGDEVHAMYRMNDGATAYFDTIRSAGGGPRFGLWIMCTKGCIEMQTNYLAQAFVLPHTSWSVPRGKKPWLPITTAGVDKPEPMTGGPHEGNVAAVKDLIAAVEQDRKPLADITDARVALEMVVAPFESQRQGRAVPMPLANRHDPLSMI